MVRRGPGRKGRPRVGSTCAEHPGYVRYLAQMACDYAPLLPLYAAQVTLRVWMNDCALTNERACILLVDDDHHVRASMRRVLVQAGHDVVEAESGDAAAVLIEEAAPFDMLVTDLRMPGPCDGLAVAACWREKAPGRPVLFVSGYSDDRLDVSSLAPHEAVLQKPFQRAALLDAVHLLLA